MLKSEQKALTLHELDAAKPLKHSNLSLAARSLLAGGEYYFLSKNIDASNGRALTLDPQRP